MLSVLTCRYLISLSLPFPFCRKFHSSKTPSDFCLSTGYFLSNSKRWLYWNTEHSLMPFLPISRREAINLCPESHRKKVMVTWERAPYVRPSLSLTGTTQVGGSMNHSSFVQDSKLGPTVWQSGALTITPYRQKFMPWSLLNEKMFC